MKLKEYLKNKKITMEMFARAAGVTQPYVSLIINGHRRPSPDIALKIERATNGKVTVLELLYPN